jgi:hypothetical protein
MSRPLIGQVLSRMGKLSAIDIDEILVQQQATRQRFGEIALSWGLCEPTHLCAAWCAQFEANGRMDLAAAGIDEKALLAIPAELARRLKVLPLKIISYELVIATTRVLDSTELAELLRVSGRDVRFVMGDGQAIERAISIYYPSIIAA